MPCRLGLVKQRVSTVRQSLSARRSPDSNRIKEKLRNGEIVVTGDQWPIFVYHGYSYDEDDPWNGLLRSSLLVTVRSITPCNRNG